jgi:S-formylglutathione hydrolase FrmB
MPKVFILISIGLFSFCSRGKSPQVWNHSEQQHYNTNLPLRDSHPIPQMGSCARAIVLDLQKGVSGSYRCNFRNSPYTFYLQIPQHPNGKVLVLLPGWNYPVMDWKHKTDVVDSALKWGFQIMLCDMGKSVYMDSIYPQAREDYKVLPTRTWLWDSILGPVSRYIGNGNLVLMGLSTGARGAILLGMEHQNEVGGVVALSGDYFPNLDTTDKLMINSMGPYSKFKFRWEKGANDVRNLDGMPDFVYLAHGMRDQWVNPEHTLNLQKRFNELKTKEMLKVRINLGVHDYTFWNETGMEGLNLYRWNASL